MSLRGGPAIVLFNRDLRVDDHPALAAAAAAGHVVPLFVIDPAIVDRASPNRVRFLFQSLADLRRSLRALGGDLVVRHGHAVAETAAVAAAVGATSVHASADVSDLAQRRQRALARAGARAGWELTLFPGIAVVPPGELRPSSGGGHFRVFTPYWRRWASTPWRAPVPAPRRIALPGPIEPGAVPRPPRGCSPEVATGGEAAGRRRLDAHLDGAASGGDGGPWHTSRLSPYLRFGCVSPLRVALAASPETTRQLCWRDFFHQVAADFPAITHTDYRPRPGRTWTHDPAGLEAWAAGRTGVPLVDAAMRQLRAEGWMPNRARLIAGMYLTKIMGIDWRRGAAEFDAWLVDGDVPCNYGNWQWVAGTGNDTRPNRTINVQSQARRFDPDGSYVRRWLGPQRPG